MTFFTTAMVGALIGSIYICFGITAYIDRSTRKEEINPFLNLLLCCFLHLIVCVVSYYFDEHPFNNSVQYILCTLYPILGYLELFYYIRYLESSCGANRRIKKSIRIFNITVLALNMVTTICLLPFGLIFSITPRGIYIRGSMFFVTYLFIFIALLVLIIFTIIVQPSPRKTAAYISYSILPIAASVIMVLLNTNSIVTDISTMLSFVILFSFVYMDDRDEILKREMKLAEYRTDIMMSQIRPHFIYNTLSTIAALCTVEPETAQSLTTEFSDYLRTNLNLAKMQKLIPFNEELNHIKKYLDIEKVRFGNRINVEYDIKETDFYVPSLSLQPIVENAVKHGILKKEEGGTIRISTEKAKDKIIIIIKDDGVGFDSENMKAEEGHYGLSTTKERIRLLLNGDFEIDSIPNEGTQIKISIRIGENS